METEKWILCPACGGKTRNRIREDTLLLNYPLYCPKCKQETLIAAKDLRITVVERPDAQTQSRWTRKISCGSPALSVSLIWIVRQIKKTELWRAVLLCLYIALQTRFEFGGIFYVLVCYDRPAAYQKQQLSYIVSRISEDNLLKKSSVARGTLTPSK